MSQHPLPKRPYRDGVRLSVVGMGGIVLIGHEQAECDRIVAEAVERGVNYFDVAPSYGSGEAEAKLGPALRAHREDVFLAVKTLKRDAAGARAELEGSLRALGTERIDLYQFHGVGSTEEAESILAPGGAMEAFRAARERGIVRFIGLSAHSEEGAVRLMASGLVDSVLFPLNFACWHRGGFGRRIMEEAARRGVARMALKAIARCPWPEGGEREYPKCWYRPLGEDEPRLADIALRWTLSHDITATVPPGDARLFRMCVETACSEVAGAPVATDELLAATEGEEPIFSS